MILADLDSERGVLGGITLHPTLIPAAIAAGLTPATFVCPAHAATFGALARVGADGLMDRPFGATRDELARAGDLGLLGPNGRDLVTMLIDALPPSVLPAAWERLLVLASARKVQAALREAHATVVRDPARACEVLAGMRGPR